MTDRGQYREVEAFDMQMNGNVSVPDRLDPMNREATNQYEKYHYGAETILPELEEPESSDAGHQSITLSVILLTSCAIVPAVMGALFYVSIGFNAADGVYYPNGTFVRPIDEGAIIGGENSFLTAHFSPLLVSSIASSVIGVVSPFAMCLFAYHLAVSWLRASSAHPTNSPTPSQYYHTLNIVTNLSPASLFLLMHYAVRQIRPSSSSPHAVRRPTPPILKLAAVGAVLVLSVTWAIRIIDIVLHEQLTSTIIYVPNQAKTAYFGRAVIADACQATDTDNCPVITRTSTANLGGLNESTIFKVYEHGSSDASRNQSVAFVGPSDVTSHTDLNYTSHTYAASTECQVYHPTCFVQNDTIQTCTPTITDGPVPAIDDWNSFVWNTGFNTSAWQMRLQTFLTLKGSLTESSNSLTNGANVNPFTTASFGCFSDYGGIPYNDSQFNTTTPFMNWWSYGAGLTNKPYILCSISICNTTVYDAEYTLYNGTLTLDNSTFTKANASSAIAVSGAGLYLGTGDTSYYQWGSRFLDDQIQMDLSSAGNTYGNSTTQFGAAMAQAFSNRYLGWSAGSIVMKEVEADSTRAELAISIPLGTSHAFAILNFAYALGIVLLGVSCLILPKRQGWGWRTSGARSTRFNAEDLRSAHVRLSDTSLLVHELASKPGPGSREGSARGEASGYEDGHTGLGGSGDLRRVSSTPLTKGWLWGGGQGESDDLRVSLERRSDGGLGFDFRKHI